MKSILKRIDFYFDEDGEKINISEMKIYWDCQTNQFRHKFNCADCGKPVGCYCYDNLDAVLREIDDGIICEVCTFEYAVVDFSAAELFELLGNPSKKLEVFLAAIKMLTPTEFGELIKLAVENDSEEEWADFVFDQLTDIILRADLEDADLNLLEDSSKAEKLREMVCNAFSDEEKANIGLDLCEDFAVGELCKL